MNSPNELKEITRFLLEYANRLMGSGVHTSRVIRNTRRIGKSLDVDVKMSLFQKTMVVSVCDIDSTEVYNEVAIIPAFPISFELNAELSATGQHVSLYSPQHSSVSTLNRLCRRRKSIIILFSLYLHS